MVDCLGLSSAVLPLVPVHDVRNVKEHLTSSETGARAPSESDATAAGVAGSATDRPTRDLLPSSHAWLSGLALGYVICQVVLPLIVIVRPGLTSRDFSWDMFSHRLSCSKFEAVTNARDESWARFRLEVDFSSWAQLSRVFPPDRLQRYANSVCRRLRVAEPGAPVQLYFVSACRSDRGDPELPLVDPQRDYCSP